MIICVFVFFFGGEGGGLDVVSGRSARRDSGRRAERRGSRVNILRLETHLR